MSSSKPDPDKDTAPSSMLLDEETLKQPEDEIRRLSRSWADSFLGHKKHHTKRWKIFTILVALSGLSIFPVLGLWFKYYNNGDQKAAGGLEFFLTQNILGGSFSQQQAKAVDIACSAIIAPIIMAALNYVWFTSARVSVVNELDSSRRGIPLATLVGASISSGGSYDPWHIFTLLRGGSWRLFMFGVLVLVSAIAKTAATNVIAYGTYYYQNVRSENLLPLRLLSDDYLNEASYALGSNAIDLDSFEMQKQSDLAGQITGLLTGLSFVASSAPTNSSPTNTNPAQKIQIADPDMEWTYARPNATAASISQANSSIVALLDVPSYLITVNCQTEQPNMVTVSQMGAYTTVINAFYEDVEFQAFYPGGIGEIQNSMNDVYEFAGFNLNNTEVYLGYLGSFNLSGGIIPSFYGDIKPQAQNMTSSGFNGTKEIMSYWGIRCSLFRRENTMIISPKEDDFRQVESSSTDKEQVPSLLSQWQTNLNYRAPRSTLPGIGPALARTAGFTTCSVDEMETVQCDNGTDFLTLANNFLYASGEVQRIAYEVVLSSEAYTNYSQPLPSGWYKVDCEQHVDVYAITYVPALLFAGLGAFLIAALLTGGMALYTARTWSAKTFRQMDPLRLVVDCGEGLQEDIRAMGVLQSLPNGALSKWAAVRMVRYSRAEDGVKRRIRLQPASREMS